MKTRLLILITLLVASIAIAATLTIDIPTADVPRVAEAYGNIAGLKYANGSPRPANVNEVTEMVRRDIINTTKDYERRKNAYTYTPTPMEMLPTPSPTPTPTPP